MPPRQHVKGMQKKQPPPAPGNVHTATAVRVRVCVCVHVRKLTRSCYLRQRMPLSPTHGSHAALCGPAQTARHTSRPARQTGGSRRVRPRRRVLLMLPFTIALLPPPPEAAANESFKQAFCMPSPQCYMPSAAQPSPAQKPSHQLIVVTVVCSSTVSRA